MSKRVLVTGGSVAANALTWWLLEGGFEVVVVERASKFREGGQSIDLRGAGRKVAERMGIEEEIDRNGTGETAWTFVDGGGKEAAASREAVAVVPPGRGADGHGGLVLHRLAGRAGDAAWGKRVGPRQPDPRTTCTVQHPAPRGQTGKWPDVKGAQNIPANARGVTSLANVRLDESDVRQTSRTGRPAGL